ncbi:Dyp-type peroxidase [Paracoccus aminophilus]|uniref:Iron-dependent peroxidase n=1 Tax=Paracoccus aminophilus JCM 7686 TaxID=1367847 RepID=S5XWW1_PARAH|nr:Dyp-type peroxidase [Paracoccus aminophilus]AGT09802.1 iron-dependent peroxidase [Paracoccus aminophilus JCM 7686]
MTAEPQPIEGNLTRASIFLVLTVHDGDASLTTLRALLADVPALVRAVGFRSFAADLSCVVGLGSDLWDRLFPGLPRPKGLHPFKEINGVHQAPSTPGDVLFHIRAESPGYCFELASLLMGRLSEVSDIADETHGFKYFDNRDLLGFVDGTENPNGRDRTAAAIIADQEPDFTGGSYVIVQKYLHDVAKWNAIPTERQEGIIGRFKLSDVEMPDAQKPSFAHNVLTTITENGVEVDILRDNMPFGSVKNGDNGTYFIGYACDVTRTERMLDRMFIGEPPGNYDRLLDVSTPVTGSLFFVPSADFLADLPQPAGAAETAEPQATEPPTTEPPAPEGQADGSLGLGSLKRDH